ncbi:MAG: hypothetical protein JJ863_10070 [Deltaproteobacteria bacterium]|nr:hypothetical protein [Deltaproteobacteria bacterium]
MMFAALVPLLIVSLLQLFVLWGLRLSVERIEAKLVGSSDGLAKPTPEAKAAPEAKKAEE